MGNFAEVKKKKKKLLGIDTCVNCAALTGAIKCEHAYTVLRGAFVRMLE